jgi:hypothetical protein
MQGDQEVAQRATGFMDLLDRFGQTLALAEQCRQVQAEERDRLAGRAEQQPSDQRQADHQRVQREVHQPRGELLPPRRIRHDRRHSGPQVYQHAQQGEGQHGQAEHEMPGLQRLARITAFREVAAQLDAGVNCHEQQQHHPMQPDRQRSVTLRAIAPVHLRAPRK